MSQKCICQAEVNRSSLLLSLISLSEVESGAKQHIDLCAKPIRTCDIRAVPKTLTVELLQGPSTLAIRKFSTRAGLSDFNQALVRLAPGDTPLNILIIGPAGAGKTTACNSFKTVSCELMNCLMFCLYIYLFWF